MLKGFLRSQSDFHLKKIEDYFKEKYNIELEELKDIFDERSHALTSNKLFEGKCYEQKGLYKIKLIHILKYLEATNEFVVKITKVNAANCDRKYVQYDCEQTVCVDYIMNLFVDDDRIYETREITGEEYDSIKSEIKKMYNSIYIP
jgi:hypothetical protein